MCHKIYFSDSNCISGEFGIVYRGLLKKNISEAFSEVVAVKTLKGKSILNAKYKYIFNRANSSIFAAWLEYMSGWLNKWVGVRAEVIAILFGGDILNIFTLKLMSDKHFE